MEIVGYIILLLLCCHISFFLGKLSKSFAIFKDLHNKGQEPKFVNIIISKTNDVFLVHGAETNEFITQGKTKSELIERLAIRYPNIKFLADKENLEAVGFIENTNDSF